MTTKILFGDIHLGRTPHKLRQLGNHCRIRPNKHKRYCTFRIAQEVEAVILAGDVVDHEKDRFEAWNMLIWSFTVGST